eukprot:404921-Rhodomonas_salina.1
MHYAPLPVLVTSNTITNTSFLPTFDSSRKGPALLLDKGDNDSVRQCPSVSHQWYFYWYFGLQKLATNEAGERKAWQW